MQVREVMTPNPATCTAAASIREIALLMAEHDCGEIPVVDENGKPAGVVTDRDIACRAVANGRDPERTTAGDIMTTPVLTARPDDSLESCLADMERHQIRRVPVVDADGSCCGMVSQADIARAESSENVAEFVRDVSQPADESSGLR
jgi:CBS domain-containing protein